MRHGVLGQARLFTHDPLLQSGLFGEGTDPDPPTAEHDLSSMRRAVLLQPTPAEKPPTV